MNPKINGGGSAFPRTESTGNLGNSTTEIVSVGGMTPRDYFAGHALVGMIQREHAYAFLDDDITSGHTAKATTNNYALAAYNLADALLKAREVKP